MIHSDSAQRAQAAGLVLYYITHGGAFPIDADSNIGLHYNQPVFAGSGFITVRNEAGQIVLQEQVAGSAIVKIVDSSVRIDPPANFPYSSKFTITVDAGFVKDAQGNGSAAVSSNFFTEAPRVPIVLTGTPGADVFEGGRGDDTLSGLGGDDELYGLEGSDILLGGDGNDQLVAGLMGKDRLEGGTGDDRLYGGEGGDLLDGGSGNDFISVTAGQVDPEMVTAIGGDGNDIFYMSLGAGSRLDASGGAGADTFTPGPYAAGATLVVSDFSAVSGGDILDLLPLVSGVSDVAGNPFGVSGYTSLLQQGSDTLLQFDADGAAGSAHTFATVAILSGVTASALTTANFWRGIDPSGKESGLTLTGTAGNDTLRGDILPDTLRGLAGHDLLEGDSSDDLLEGGEGNDILKGGPGNDKLLGEAGSDYMLGEAGNDSLDGGGDNDELRDDSGNNTLSGGDGNDLLVSQGRGASTLDGGAGHDKLVSGSGSDTLLGGAGMDTFLVDGVYGQARFEGARTMVLNGGADDDTFQVTMPYNEPLSLRATGGAGRDTYVLRGNARSADYIIDDFAVGPGGDLIDVTSYIKRMGDSVNPFDPAAKTLLLVQRGADTVMQGYYTSEGTTQLYDIVTLKGIALSSLTASNFVWNISPDGKRTDLTLTGGAGNDVLEGQYLDDVLSGGGGADTLYGLYGNDRLFGGDGNDRLAGGYGSNQLDGGAGLDTAFYNFSGYNTYIERDGAKWLVRDYAITNGIVQWSDTMVDVERLRFADRSYALDIDGTGGQVYRLYQAAFNRTPDKVGLGFWISKVDNGLPMAQVLDFFLNSPEFASLYGAKPSNVELVGRFYQNVLHREPDAVGKAFWIDVLDQGRASVADVLSFFSESPENRQEVAKIIGTGFEYQEFV